MRNVKPFPVAQMAYRVQNKTPETIRFLCEEVNY